MLDLHLDAFRRLYGNPAAPMRCSGTRAGATAAAGTPGGCGGGATSETLAQQRHGIDDDLLRRSQHPLGGRPADRIAAIQDAVDGRNADTCRFGKMSDGCAACHGAS